MSSFSFSLNNIPIEVEYRNVKTMRITVYRADGRVKISAPPGAESRYIREFAASKSEWIERHLKKSEGLRKNSGPLRNNSDVYIWGEAHRLELVERAGNSRIAVGGGIVRIFVQPMSPKSKAEEVLDKWYRRSLKEKAAPVIAKWEEIIGVKVSKLYVRKMKTHWGSCNFGKRTLRLNSELAKRNIECLEYVIVHEMLHIIEKGHNRNFYGLLNLYIPCWKAIRKKMNKGEI